MDNKYSNNTKQEIKCLIARHGDTKRQLEKELFEVENNLRLMAAALKGKGVENE